MPSCLRDYPLPAPNFGKTAGVLKIPIEAAGYENAKGFSEIGRRGRKPRRGAGAAMKYGMQPAKLAGELE